MSGGMTPLVLDRVLTLATNNAARLAYAAGNDHRLHVYANWWEAYPNGVHVTVYDRLAQSLNGAPNKLGWVLLPDYEVADNKGHAVSDHTAQLITERAEYWRGRIKWLQSLGLLKPATKPQPKEVP